MGRIPLLLDSVAMPALATSVGIVFIRRRSFPPVSVAVVMVVVPVPSAPVVAYNGANFLLA